MKKTLVTDITSVKWHRLELPPPWWQMALSPVNDRPKETVGQRVARAMKARGVGFNELDRALGKGGEGYTSRLVNSTRKPRSDTLSALARALHVNLGWLTTGEGHMNLEMGKIPEHTPPRVIFSPEAPRGYMSQVSPDIIEKFGNMIKKLQELGIAEHEFTLPLTDILRELGIAAMNKKSVTDRLANIEKQLALLEFQERMLSEQNLTLDAKMKNLASKFDTTYDELMGEIEKFEKISAPNGAEYDDDEPEKIPRSPELPNSGFMDL